MCDKEGQDMTPAVAEKKEIKTGLNVDPRKFKEKVPHLNVIDGVAIINPEDPLQKKWFEEFKK